MLSEEEKKLALERARNEFERTGPHWLLASAIFQTLIKREEQKIEDEKSHGQKSE